VPIGAEKTSTCRRRRTVLGSCVRRSILDALYQAPLADAIGMKANPPVHIRVRPEEDQGST